MRPTFWILLIALIFWILGMSWCHTSICNCGSLGAAGAVVPAAVSGTDEAPLKFISFNDDDRSYNASLYDNLLFAQSECMYESPISDSLGMVFQSLADHLSANEDRIILLTGLYQDSETNNCTADDLGIARAESVQQLLVDKGVSDNQIRLTSNNQNILDSVDDKIMGGITYSFISGDMSEIEDRLRSQNITLYFDTNQENIYLDGEQKQYFDDLKYFLSRSVEAKALVTGHTDDEGSESSNERLSRKRAETVRNYMADQGIDIDQIIAKGMGPEEPIASNDTAEGRRENRRVEITIE